MSDTQNQPAAYTVCPAGWMDRWMDICNEFLSTAIPVPEKLTQGNGGNSALENKRGGGRETIKVCRSFRIQNNSHLYLLELNE